MASMIGFLVYCGAYWKGNQFVGPTTFACCVSKNAKGIYSEMVEKLYDRIWVSRDIFKLKITSQLTGISLVINADDEVNFFLMHNKLEWPEIHVEVVDKSVHQTLRKTRNTTINLECTPPPFTSTNNLHSPAGTPHYKLVSGSNHPHGYLPSPSTTSPGNNQGTPASTNKHAEVDDTYDSETSDTEDESCTEGDTSKDPNGVSEVPQCGGLVETGAGEAPTDGEEERGGVSGAANSSAPFMTSRWTIPGSGLYSIQPIRSKDLFENQGDQGQLYKGQILKDKQTLRGVIGLYALEKGFEYKVRRSSHTRYATTCRKKGCEWVITAGKLKNGTYWHVKSFVKEHTCDDSGNYNIDFKRVSSYVIGELFARKFADPGCTLRPKDIISEFRDKHDINLSYNKAYRSKTCALHKAFGDPWESFKMLPSFFYMLEQSNPVTVTKIETDSENRFAYGFMALGACIEGFNTVIRQIIAIDATHLKAKTKGVLLVAVCKDGNEMIYPLAFGFAHSECTESWTWFLKQLRIVIRYLERMMLVLDRHAGIFTG
ncbi:hypothetical protein Dsin_009212 [Dipteronia sinensis]|uniref:Transposase MuDR plant domain-containing protein n=1 Tax=Dipteronia sinensis TaxID=43782 RepID=A0AAE0EBW3_9ROSI|nr:hypothetical protein Dsin_009212 [Dipteronia sinensis]